MEDCPQLFAELKQRRDALCGQRHHTGAEISGPDVAEREEARSDHDETAIRHGELGGTSERKHAEDMMPVTPFGSSSKKRLADLRECLRLNEKYQGMLIEVIEQLTMKWRSNQETQEELRQQSGMHKGNAPRWITRSLTVFGSPYFKDVNGMRSPANEDESSKKRGLEQDPHLKPPRPWSRMESTMLHVAVRRNLRENVMLALQNKRDRLKMDKTPSTQNLRELGLLEVQIHALTTMKTDKLLDMANGRIDWLKISAVDLDGQRSGRTCELMWKNWLNKGSALWTKEEDSQLLQLVQSRGACDWDDVANLMGGERTPFQYAERFHHHLDRKTKLGRFSPEEDQRLLLLVSLYRSGDEIPWVKVARHMESRTSTQLCSRWEAALNPLIRRGRWRREEDMMLVAAVEAHGEHWTRVKDFVPGRTALQCRDRYMNVFAGNFTIGKWSPEEDSRLIELVKAYGPGKWAMISREMEIRNDNMVQARYKRLLKIYNCNDPNSLEKLVKERPWKGRKTPDTSQLRKAVIVREVESATQEPKDGGVSKRRRCSMLYESFLQRHLLEPPGGDDGDSDIKPSTSPVCPETFEGGNS
ncbi:snRNA-activating protein complex subunit 4-like isoform X2 [Haemaphysalis longicornis]